MSLARDLFDRTNIAIERRDAEKAKKDKEKKQKLFENTQDSFLNLVYEEVEKGKYSISFCIPEEIFNEFCAYLREREFEINGFTKKTGETKCNISWAFEDEEEQ